MGGHGVLERSRRSVTSNWPTITSPRRPCSTSTTSNTTRDGVHIASLAGACIAALAGFGRLRDRSGRLSLAPRLPQALTRLAFSIRCRATTQLRVEVKPAEATYTRLMGDSLEINHHRKPITVTHERPVQCPIPPLPALERPTQPPGREPVRRHVRSGSS